MVEVPKITHEADGSRVVWDVSTLKPRAKLAFLGWVLLGVTAGVVLYDVRRWQLATGAMDYLVPLVTALVGILLLRTAGRAQQVERPLLRVSPPQAELVEDESLPSPPRPLHVELCGTKGPRRVEVGELTHVVFGLIDYPWPGRRGIEVEAFALYLAKADGTPIPVVDGTLERSAAFRIAEELSAVLRLPLITLGKGA